MTECVFSGSQAAHLTTACPHSIRQMRDNFMCVCVCVCSVTCRTSLPGTWHSSAGRICIISAGSLSSNVRLSRISHFTRFFVCANVGLHILRAMCPTLGLSTTMNWRKNPPPIAKLDTFAKLQQPKCIRPKAERRELAEVLSGLIQTPRQMHACALLMLPLLLCWILRLPSKSCFTWAAHAGGYGWVRRRRLFIQCCNIARAANNKANSPSIPYSRCIYSVCGAPCAWRLHRNRSMAAHTPIRRTLAQPQTHVMHVKQGENRKICSRCRRRLWNWTCFILAADTFWISMENEWYGMSSGFT